MKKTDGSQQFESKGNTDILVMIFFTGCTPYLLDCVSYSDDTAKANLIAHKTWCGGCTLVAGNVDTSGVNILGTSCVYPSNNGCGGKTSESCYLGCVSGEESGISYSAVMLGDTGSKSGLMAGLVDGCLCVTCDENSTAFGYYLPSAYEAASTLETYQNAQETADIIDSCLGN